MAGKVVVAVMPHALLVVHAARIMPMVGVLVDQVAVLLMLQIMVEGWTRWVLSPSRNVQPCTTTVFS